MQLKSFHIWNYKNIDDSNEIIVDQNVTCFVGKNEAGKTALLQALYRLNPVEDVEYDEVKDYPRKRLREYQRKLKAGKEESAKVITADFELDNDDIAAVVEEFGDCISQRAILTVTKKYDGSKVIGLNIDEQKWVKHYTSNSNLSGNSAQKAKTTKSLDSLISSLEECEDDAVAQQHLSYLTGVADKGIIIEIWQSCLKERVPKIFFFDDYRIMKGRASLDQLDSSADEGVRTLKDLLDLAGITAQELRNNADYEHHKANLEAIANEITDDVFVRFRVIIFQKGAMLCSERV